MPDIYYDVDAALSEVPVNIFPLVSDSDGKTIQGAVAYNAAGMALRWHFCTSAGAYTVTSVTPTTAGNYDWTDQGDSGIYTIEIPASGGASINNDTEGYGWFSGVATGIMPWRSPIFGFRAAAINDSLCDAGATGLLAPTVAGRTLDVSATGEAGLDFANVNMPAGQIPIAQILDNGTMQAGSAAGTAVLRAGFSAGADDRVNGATLWITGGTGAGQRRIVHDSVDTTDTVSVSPNWDATPDNTSTYILYPTPIAPTNAAAMVSVSLGAIGGDTQSMTDLKDFVDAGYDPATNKVQGVVLTDTVTTYTGNTVQTGDAFARLGAPAGASIAADIAVIESQTDDIGVAGAGLTALATQASVNTIDDFLDTEVAAILAAVDTEVAAIKAKTDSLTFTVAGQVDANMQRINDVAVTGDGSAGDKFDVV